MNIATKVKFLLEVQVQFRINHWQTKGFARHNAFGGFYEVLDGLIDTFIEASMGKYGRFTLDDETKTIQLNNLSDIDMKGLITTVRSAFVQMELDPTDTDLLNIRDEILADINQFLYLMTFDK